MLFLGLPLVDDGLQHGIGRRKILLQRGQLRANLAEVIEPNARKETVDFVLSPLLESP